VSRIAGPIDESSLVMLRGMRHPLANATNDRGAAPDALRLDRLQLVLKRSASQEAALRRLIAEMHAPGSANYHKWLTPEQFGAQFGPSDEDLAAVESWLAGHGFNVVRVNPGRQTLEIAGSVAQMRSAFHTEIHRYEVRGETHYANASDPQIPAALAPVVGGFFSLNNFRARSYSKLLGAASYDPKTGRARPQWTIGPGSPAIANNYVLSPADYAVQYDLQKLYSSGVSGTGQTIAIVNESNINLDLVNQFRSLFLPAYPANQTQVIVDGDDPGVDGINNFDGPNFASSEAYLDVEWAGAVAPNATIDLVIAADTALEDGLDLAMIHAVDSNVAPVLSLSFGQCELFLEGRNQAIDSLWEQAAAQGITVVVSAGDNGVAGCDNDNQQEYAIDGQAVSGYASTPFNVAVGGTDFYYSSFNQGESAIDAQLATYWNTAATNSAPTPSLLQPIPEQPWNNSQYADNLVSYYADLTGGSATTLTAGSGGASNAALCSTSIYNSLTGACSGMASGYAKPAWQSLSITGVPNDQVRDLPDVSLFAANGLNDSYYPVCAADGDCQPAASGGAVQITGIGGTSASAPAFAGIMALVNQATGSRQGQADTVLYPLEQQFPAAFHDVTVGTISVPCEFAPTKSTNCIAVTNPIVLSSNVTEGEIGNGTTAEYNATAGYDLATGLGTLDAYNLVTDWSKVKFAASATTLTPSSTTFTHGTAITVTGSVTGSGTPTGDVALMTDSADEAQQGETFFPLSGGSFTSATDFKNGIGFLPGGTYHLWGQYGGDTANAMSSSTPVQITVNPESSAIDLNMVADGLGAIFQPGGGPGTQVDYGTQLLLSAAVAPASLAAALQNCLVNNVGCGALSFTTPTGVVVFKDGSTTLNTTALNVAGDAEYVAPYAVGAHSVTANYAGDNSYSAAAATSPIAFTVVKDAPEVLLGFSTQAVTADPVNGPGQPTVLTFILENGAEFNSGFGGVPTSVAAPTGTVTLASTPAGLSGSAQLGAITDPFTRGAASVATFTFAAGSVSGPYTLSLSYTGDGNYQGFTNLMGSGPLTVNPTGASGLLSSTTTAAVTSANASSTPNAALVITGSVTGSGSAAPTGSIQIYSSGMVPAAVAFGSSTGSTSSFTAVLDSRALLQGVNYITIQYTGDAKYNPSAMVLSMAVQNPQSDFTMVPNTTIVPVAVGSGGSTAINLGSVNGFSGTVNLSCTAATVTCSVTPTVSLSGGGIGSATLTVNAAAGTALGTYNVMVMGKDGATGEYVHALGLQAVVAAATPGITLSSSGSITVSRGATTNNTSTITVTPTNGFTGTVSLACSISPTAASDPATCSFSQSPVTIGGTVGVSSTLTIATKAASSAMNRPPELLWSSTGGAVLALIFFFKIPGRRRGWPAMLGLLVFFACAAGMGCGGTVNSSGGGGNGDPGTTAGTYTVTVTGTPSAGAVQTLAVTLTVN
jgi:hypothetical protein